MFASSSSSSSSSSYGSSYSAISSLLELTDPFSVPPHILFRASSPQLAKFDVLMADRITRWRIRTQKIQQPVQQPAISPSSSPIASPVSTNISLSLSSSPLLSPEQTAHIDEDDLNNWEEMECSLYSNSSDSGWDLQFIQPPDEDYICAICQLVCKDAVETPCSHLFCGRCLVNWLRMNPCCPVDRTPLSLHNNSSSTSSPNSSIHVAGFVRRKILLLKIKCPLNCGATIEVGQIKSHIADSICPVAITYEKILAAVHTPPWKESGTEFALPMSTLSSLPSCELIRLGYEFRSHVFLSDENVEFFVTEEKEKEKEKDSSRGVSNASSSSTSAATTTTDTSKKKHVCSPLCHPPDGFEVEHLSFNQNDPKEEEKQVSHKGTGPSSSSSLSSSLISATAPGSTALVNYIYQVLSKFYQQLHGYFILHYQAYHKLSTKDLISVLKQRGLSESLIRNCIEKEELVRLAFYTRHRRPLNYNDGDHNRKCSQNCKLHHKHRQNNKPSIYSYRGNANRNSNGHRNSTNRHPWSSSFTSETTIEDDIFDFSHLLAHILTSGSINSAGDNSFVVTSAPLSESQLFQRHLLSQVAREAIRDLERDLERDRAERNREAQGPQPRARVQVRRGQESFQYQQDQQQEHVKPKSCCIIS